MEKYSDTKTSELDKWKLTNHQLRRHKLKAVTWCVGDYPPDGEAGLIIRVDEAELLRHTITTLMSDCNRREDFIEELIASNKQLREKIAALELTNQNNEMKIKMDSLKKVNSYSNAESSNFSEIYEIKYNEERLQDQHHDIDVSRINFRPDSLSTSSTSSTSAERIKRRANTKMSDKKYADLAAKYGRLQDENEILKLELTSRPEIKDMRELQVRVRQLQRMLKDNNRTATSKVDGSTEYGVNKSIMSRIPLDLCHKLLKDIAGQLDVTDVNEIQGRLCRFKINAERINRYENFLACLDRILPAEIAATSRLNGFSCEASGDAHRLQMLTARVQNAITTASLSSPPPSSNVFGIGIAVERLLSLIAPRHRLPLMSSSPRWKCSSSSSSPSSLPPPMSPEVSTRSPPCSSRIPASPRMPASAHSLEAAIQSLCNDLESSANGTCSGAASISQYTQCQLKAVVVHVMAVFDIVTPDGIFAAVSVLRRKYAEQTNAFSVLKDTLGIDMKSSTHDVVTAVTTVLRGLDKATANGKYLPTEINSLLKQNSEQAEFLAAFQHMIDQLFTALDVVKIDEIVPAVYHLMI